MSENWARCPKLEHATLDPKLVPCVSDGKNPPGSQAPAWPLIAEYFQGFADNFQNLADNFQNLTDNFQNLTDDL